MIYVDDPDFTLHQGDVLDVLPRLEPGSVDCVVTSPPYWGLRDYGTGAWDGNPDCDHLAPLGGGYASSTLHEYANGLHAGSAETVVRDRRKQYRDVCGKCGARRIDRQLGLEATPDLYVERMVDVFREIRRVLSDSGTLFLNIGDSYASSSIPMQRVRSDDSRARESQGPMPSLLSPDGAAAVGGKEPRKSEGQVGGVASGEQGTGERRLDREASPATSPDHGNAGCGMPVLRGDGASVLDDRPCPERRGTSQENRSTPHPQEDSGRGLSARPVSDPLLELQLGEGAARSLPPYGDIKQKDLVGIPWMLALALRADGWYLRSEIIWAKPNPMPESVTDRPTKAHEQIFLLTKAARYFYDADAVREPLDPETAARAARHPNGEPRPRNVDVTRNDGDSLRQFAPPAGRNLRSVWEIPTQPYPEAHFATYPEALVERCLKAGCPEGGTVLDPFLGSGTTAQVARRLGRRCVGIELSGEYVKLAARRLQQLSLLA